MMSAQLFKTTESMKECVRQDPMRTPESNRLWSNLKLKEEGVFA
jgi:hypothetical protein